MPALFLCAQKRRGAGEAVVGRKGGRDSHRESEGKRGGKSRQIKWSEKCPHERELASSSSGVGEEEEIPPSAVEIRFHTKTRREINSP